MIRAMRLLTLVLAALAWSLTSAHVLEMPQKLGYDAQLYAAVNTTLYRYFAIVGGVYSIGAILAAVGLAWLTRTRRQTFIWTVAGAALYVLWFVSWVTIVAPVNAEVATAMETAPGSVAALWASQRGRWEYGHAVGFALELLGFCALVMSVLVDAPDEVVPGARPN